MIRFTLPLLLAASAAQATPTFGRHMPLYPGQYLNASFSSDDGDRAFAADGSERDTSVPSLAGRTQLPRDAVEMRLTWHFPLFETYELPFVSSRMWVAAASLRFADTQAEGALADFALDDSDDADTDADELRTGGSGVGDASLSLGTYLYGAPSSQWRTRERAPLAVLARLGLDFPVGDYHRDAPVSAGSNTPALWLELGLHAQPWNGAFIDAGLRLTEYYKNQDPAFGALAPSQQGDRWSWDLSLAQRLGGGVYLSVFASGFDNEANRYDNPRFAPNPPPTDIPFNTDNYPTPGSYFDRGTELRSAGVGLSAFLTQRLLLGLHYSRPLSGRSGEFDLPYTNRTPAGCTPGSVGCLLRDGDSVRVDGLGPARSLASDRLTLTLQFNFLARDTFNCVGCEKPR